MSDTIVLPWKYTPRAYQLPFWRHMESGAKRYVGVWHRRAGKDRTLFAWLQKSMMQRVGLYWHILPDAEQGRKIIWNGMTDQGERFIDMFPRSLVKRSRDDHMLIELVNGSIYQVVGAVGSDGTSKHLRGANPVGAVFSECAFYAHDEAWNVVRPILNENGGWAVFISTPIGRNWFHDLYQRAQLIPGWKAELYTVNDTRRDDGTPVITQEAIEEDRLSGYSEAKIQQEYYCSFDSPFEGAIWADDINRIRREGRICEVRHNGQLPVETWWDLGMNDPGAIWFLQRDREQRNFIDYHQQSDWSLQDWIKFVKDKPYVYSRHVVPWDIGHRSKDTGKRGIDFAYELGLRMTAADKPADIGDQITAARAFMRRWDVRFDAVKCAVGIDALSQYRWKKDRTGLMPSEQVVKDLHEHGAAAFRTGVTKDDDADVSTRPRQVIALSDYDPLRGVNVRDILAGERQTVAIMDDAAGDSHERFIWWGQGS